MPPSPMRAVTSYGPIREPGPIVTATGFYAIGCALRPSPEDEITSVNSASDGSEVPLQLASLRSRQVKGERVKALHNFSPQ